MSSSSPGQESGAATSPEWGGRRADRTRATSAEGLVAGGLIGDSPERREGGD